MKIYYLNLEQIQKLIKQGGAITLSTIMLASVIGCSAKVPKANISNEPSTTVENPVNNQEGSAAEIPITEKDDTSVYNPHYLNNQEMKALTTEMYNIVNNYSVNEMDKDIVQYIQKYPNPAFLLYYLNDANAFDNNDVLTKESRAETYSLIGMMAYIDLKQNGEFSDVWFNSLLDNTELEKFQNNVQIPLEEAYSTGNYNTVIADLEKYYASGSLDYINNIKVSATYFLITQQQDKKQEEYTKISEIYENIMNEYIKGTEISSSDNQYISRHA